MLNCLIGGNTAPEDPDIEVRFPIEYESLGHNLVEQAGFAFLDAQPTDLLGVAPGTAGLADRGGFGLVMDLLPGSPAIDAGTNMDGPDIVLLDQTGGPRVVGPQADIGAYEFVPVTGPVQGWLVQ